MWNSPNNSVVAYGRVGKAASHLFMGVGESCGLGEMRKR